jgi:beta-glucosidase
VTENGIATDDDRLRCEFLNRHLAALGAALERGVDVRGYCHWSLVDNFEWTFGRTMRFGLASVEPASQQRTLKPSARLYAAVCRENRVTAESHAETAPVP